MTPERPSQRRTKDYTSSEARFAPWRDDTFVPKDLSSRIRRIRWERAGVIVGVAAAFLAFGYLLNQHVFVLLWILPTALIGLIKRTWSRRPVPEVSVLLDLPAAVPQFPVRLKLEADSQTYGRDEGVVSFVDGWLHFHGLRTEFSVTPWSVDPYFRRRPNDHPVGYLSLHYTVDEVPFRAKLLPYGEVSGVENPFKGEFPIYTEAWTRTARRPEGTAVLPPIRPEPTAVSGYDRDRRLLYFALSVCLGALTLLALKGLPYGLLSFKGLVPVVAVAAIFVALRVIRTRIEACRWLSELPIREPGTEFATSLDPTPQASGIGC